jgi:hypothetical protein
MCEIVNLKHFRAESVATHIAGLHEKCHPPVSSGILVIAVNPEAEYRFGAVAIKLLSINKSVEKSCVGFQNLMPHRLPET